MKDYFRWLRNVFRYVAQWLSGPGARVAWLMLLVPLVCAAVALWLRTEPAFRWFGGALQALGILTVVLTIQDTRTRFGRPGFFVLARQFLSGFPRLRPTPITVNASAIISGVGMGRANLSVWHSPPIDARIERRVDSLEKNLLIVRDRSHEFERETAKGFQQQTDAFNQEKQTRADEDRTICVKLEESQVSGLHVSIIGIAWLLIGLLMSTGSDDFARWFRADNPAATAATASPIQPNLAPVPPSGALSH